MSSNPDHEPELIVAARPTGANGIPEPTADLLDELSSEPFDRERAAASYLPWIALGAVVVGSFGAIVGLIQRPARTRTRPKRRAVADAGDVTPPHGDKLLSHEAPGTR